MECQAAILVGSLDAWLPSCGEEANDVLSRRFPATEGPGGPEGCHSHSSQAGALGVASASSSAAPVPIPFSRAATAARSCSPRTSPVADADSDDDDSVLPLDSDFLDCLARKQHSFLTQAMAARRGGGVVAAAADRDASAARASGASSGCCGTDGSGVSDASGLSGSSSMWASSSAASSMAVRSVGWSGSGSAFSNSIETADACEAFGSLSSCGGPAAPPAPLGSARLLDKAAAAAAALHATQQAGRDSCRGSGRASSCSGGGGSASSCIPEGTVHRGRPRLTISSACSLPLPMQHPAGPSSHTARPHPLLLGSLCNALSSPACPQSLASSFAHPQQRQRQQQQQQRSFERILPPPTASPAPALHSSIDCITAQRDNSCSGGGVNGGHLLHNRSPFHNSTSGSGHAAASEAAAAAAAFALSLCSLPDHCSSSSSGDDDSEGYESCSEREAAASSSPKRLINSCGGGSGGGRDDNGDRDNFASDDYDDLDLSASCGGSSAGGGGLPATEQVAPLPEAAAEAAEAAVESLQEAETVRRGVLQPQLTAMRLGWLQSIASACGIIAAAGGGTASASSTSPAAVAAPLPLPLPRLAPTPVTAPQPVHAAMVVPPAPGVTPISTRRGLFEGTVSGGSPRNAWQWHGAVNGSVGGAASAQR